MDKRVDIDILTFLKKFDNRMIQDVLYDSEYEDGEEERIALSIRDYIANKEGEIKRDLRGIRIRKVLPLSVCDRAYTIYRPNEALLITNRLTNNKCNIKVKTLKDINRGI